MLKEANLEQKKKQAIFQSRLSIDQIEIWIHDV